MIVKNEASIIKKCLASVKEIIDYWVIVDTGSNDGTQDLILDMMKDIPGELHEYPWVDFSHNRNQALFLAKGKADYHLFIDADETLKFFEPLKKGQLEKDCYFVTVRESGDIEYHRELLVRSALNWQWKGSVHEAISCPEAKTYAVLKNVINLSVTEEGNRYRDPDKYMKDAKALEKDFQIDPKNPRTVFYLAMSYKNGGAEALALKYFAMRAKMGDIEEEVFYSLLNVAILEQNLGVHVEQFLASYAKAYLYRPTRAEPLFWMANYYNQSGSPLMAYLLSKEGLSIPFPKDLLFVQKSIYDTELLLLLADSSYSIGKYKETLQCYEKLLKNSSVSNKIKERIEQNYKTIKNK